jgi:DNA-binding transcriptional LysR family regulator
MHAQQAYLVLERKGRVMELRTLRYFAEVAKAGTVSAAAETLHVTQPGLSRQLRQLERQLGIPLFDRNAGRLTLSAAGRALLPRVHQLLADAERVAIDARVLATGRLDRMTIAAPATTLAEVIAPFIATLAPADPTPSAFACDGYEPRAALRAGADLVITNGRPLDALRSIAVGVLPVWAYLPKAHRLATRVSIDLADLEAETIISLPTTFSARQVLDAAAQHTHQTVSIDVEASSGAVAQALAAAGRGIAVVTDDPRFDLTRMKVLAGGNPMNLHLFAAWDPGHPAHSTLAAIARRLAEHVDDHYGSSP